MEVQAHCQALIRDANRSCYVHHCKRSSVTFCDKNNLLSGFFKIRLMLVVKVRRPYSKADLKGKLRVV